MPNSTLLRVNNQKGIAQVLVLVLILGGIVAGVYLVQQRTNLLPKASGPISCNPKEKDDQVIRQTWTKLKEGKCKDGSQDARYSCGKKERKVKQTCPIPSSTPKATPVACYSDRDCKNDDKDDEVCIPRSCPVPSCPSGAIEGDCIIKPAPCLGICGRPTCPTPPPCENGIVLYGDPLDPKECPVYFCSTPSSKPTPI